VLKKNENNLNYNKMKLQRKFIALVLFMSCFQGYSQINVTTNFRIQTNLPIDNRMVATDLTARDAINTLYRFEGLKVYVLSNQTNYQLVGGITNANWQTLNLIGYSVGTGLTLSGNTLSHSAHTGDVTGITSLTIAAIQGRTLATTAPNSGDVMGWNGSAWAPVTALSNYTTGTGITISGNTISAQNTTALWNANQINGSSISTTAPTGTQILKWNGTEWAPANEVAYASGTGITLTGNTFSADNTSAIWNANQIMGTVISTTAPDTNQILKWDGAMWVPSADNLGNFAAGTGLGLTGTTFFANTSASIWNANKLQGVDVSVTPPLANEVLKFDGTEWVPQADNNTTYSANGLGLSLSGTSFSANYSSSIWNASQLQGQDVSATPPTANQVLEWNGSIWIPTDQVVHAAGTGLTLTANTFSANNTDPIWNANQINGSAISTTAPASNQLLKWNGTDWAPADEVAYAAGTGITLTGNTFAADNTSAIWNANQINGSAISTTAPASNQLLKWNGTEWTPADEVAYAAGTGITLTANTFAADNTSAIWNANQINGSAISTTAPASNQLLKWNGTEWAPADEVAYAAGTGITLTGNTFAADNTSAIWNANQINGSAISTTAPASNQLLKWNGTDWAPADEVAYAAGTGITLTANTFAADNTSAIWNANQINGSAISTTAPASNQLLKWNGTDWAPADEVAYAAGTGLTLTGSTFLADNTSAIWNANQIMGSAISTTAPTTNGQILKWNSATSEWEPGSETVYSAGSGLILTGTTFSISGPVAVNLGGTGQTTYTDGQILIGNTSGSLTKSTITSGTGITVTNGDGSITIANSDPNQTHTGDATGSGALTVVGIQGRNIATTAPTDADVLTWDNALSVWKPAQTTNSGTFNGNRAIKRAAWPYNINMGTTTNVNDFLNAVFFPFLSASISINASVLYEVGTSNSVTISGSTTAQDETIFSNGRIDETYPSTTTVYTFGAATSYSTNITFTPDQSVTSSLELRYVAYQGVGNNGSPTTINSSTKLVQSVYPYLHGVHSDNLTAGGTDVYTKLSGKIVQAKSNKTVSLTGSGYIYFCYPASYGTLTSILDHNGFEQISAFNYTTSNVTSSGLVNNWTTSYYIYQSNNTTVPAAWNYQFKY
jgi:hypothetical protein